MADDVAPIVVDNGSGNIRAGFAGDDAPSVAFRHVVGIPRYPAVMAGMGQRALYCGEFACAKRALLTLRSPMDRGAVQDWHDEQAMWHNIFYDELRVATADAPVLVTETLFTPKKDREKLIELFFEEFKIPACYVAIQNILQLYASGHLGGTYMSLGDGTITTLQLIDGYMMPYAGRLEFGGRDLTNYMIRMLHDSGHRFTTSCEFEIAKDLKEKLCYVADDSYKELEIAATSARLRRTFELPDGNTITIDTERFKCMESLFDPSLLGIESMGIHELILKQAFRYDVDFRKYLWGGVFISGGIARCPGLATRLKSQMDAHLIGRAPSRVIEIHGNQYATWIGGSILASLSNFQQMWISKEEYDENGATIGHRKCPYAQHRIT